MFIVKVKNLKGEQTHGAEFSDEKIMQDWISNCVENNYWGKPDRWVKKLELSEEELTKFDEEKSTEFGPEQENYMICHFPAEYTVTTTEEFGPKQVAREKLNADSLAYLASTDWYVVRFAEAGVKIPEEVSLARSEARSKIVRAV